MKKSVPLVTYIIGWIYPVSANIFAVLDNYIRIKVSYFGPFNFYNDSIMGYVLYSFIISVATFLIFFIYSIIKFKPPKSFYFVLFNLPLYFASIFASVLYTDTYLWVGILSLIITLSVIVFSVAYVLKLPFEDK